MVDVSLNLAFCYYPTCPAERRCLASSEWFVVECLMVCCIFTHSRHDVEALVVPSLGPDSILLDNSVTFSFGAVLDWENQVLSLPSTGNSTPAVHRTNHPPSRSTDPSTASGDPNLSVAAVHHDVE